MRTKLEAIANVTVIVLALAVGYTVLRRNAGIDATPRSPAIGEHSTTESNVEAPHLGFKRGRFT